MTTLPPDGMIYGVHKETLAAYVAAYVAAERAEVWEAAELIAWNHVCPSSHELCRCANIIADAIKAQAAKETT